MQTCEGLYSPSIHSGVKTGEAIVLSFQLAPYKLQGLCSPQRTGGAIKRLVNEKLTKSARVAFDKACVSGRYSYPFLTSRADNGIYTKKYRNIRINPKNEDNALI